MVKMSNKLLKGEKKSVNVKVSSSKKRWFDYLRYFLIFVIGFVLGTLFIKYWLLGYLEERSYREYLFGVSESEVELLYEESKSKLVREVSSYIDSVACSSNLNGYALVQMCERYDLDIRFVLAQGQLESHFGTTGLAIKTNSVFNVGAYDGLGVNEINGRYKYRHPDYSIEPYMRLLYRDYLVGSKTEFDLMVKYVNKSGKRYSSNENYERELTSLFGRISECTKIGEYQGEMKRYGIICGK